MVAYIVAPWDGKGERLQRVRAQLATAYTAQMWVLGQPAYCPLALNQSYLSVHPQFVEALLNLERRATLEYSHLNVLESCDELHVLKLPDWRECGVVVETISVAKSLRIPTRYINVAEIEGHCGWPLGTAEELLGARDVRPPKLEKGKRPRR